MIGITVICRLLQIILPHQTDGEQLGAVSIVLIRLIRCSPSGEGGSTYVSVNM